MEEEIKFGYNLVLLFSDLQHDLIDRIENKLYEEKFYDKSFEVLKILSFIIKDIVITDYNIVCNLSIKALCNNPSINKIFNVDNYIIKNNKIIYASDRIQIIAELKNIEQDVKKLRILNRKIVYKNILCVAEII